MYTITDAQEKSMAMDVDGDGDGRVGSPANLPGSHGEQVADLLAKAAMRCGGCGSKVGSTALKRVLKKLSRWARRRGHASLRDRPDICAGIGDDAAVTVPPNPTTHRLVQTVDFFRSFIPDPYLFGQVTAQHALSDCFAMNAQPLTALAMCTVPFGTEAMTEETLLHLLAGASLVLERAGCVLVGGHTCEAAEVSLGFSITGSAAISDVLPKGPALPGASIILTKVIHHHYIRPYTQQLPVIHTYKLTIITSPAKGTWYWSPSRGGHAGSRERALGTRRSQHDAPGQPGGGEGGQTLWLYCLYGRDWVWPYGPSRRNASVHGVWGGWCAW